jgi:NAD(P)-dependent dehydrogenase (short-subunit alcohol dehydrogenase family)
VDLEETYGESLLPLAVDVTDREAVARAVEQSHTHFGRFDVVVNNAGYGHLAAVEEVTEELARDQFDTNFFGALWVIQAVLPILREQGHGRIIQVSSVVGITAPPLLGVYSASKWALEAMSEALAGEVRPFGISVTIVEPGGYRTGQSGEGRPGAAAIPAYQALRAQYFGSGGGDLRGDPRATRAAILRLVDADDPPLRLLLGSGLLEGFESTYAARLETWREWEPISIAAQGDPPG